MSPAKVNARRGACAVKASLIEELQDVQARLVDVSNQEIEAVVHGNRSADFSLVMELRAVEERRGFVIRRFKEHRANHRC